MNLNRQTNKCLFNVEETIQAASNKRRMDGDKSLKNNVRDLKRFV
jgi:hypothetical protein